MNALPFTKPTASKQWREQLQHNNTIKTVFQNACWYVIQCMHTGKKITQTVASTLLVPKTVISQDSNLRCMHESTTPTLITVGDIQLSQQFAHIQAQTFMRKWHLLCAPRWNRIYPHNTDILLHTLRSIRPAALLTTIYTVSQKKRPTFTTCYNFYIHSSIATIFGTDVAEKVCN